MSHNNNEDEYLEVNGGYDEIPHRVFVQDILEDVDGVEYHKGEDEETVNP